MTASDLIRYLDLSPLPLEGGWFRRTYTSSARTADGSAVGSAIYYLVTPESSSALHRLHKADELFHYYCGDPAEMIQWHTGDSHVRRYILGNRIERGEQPQMLVQAGCWQGLRLIPGGQWALFGVSVYPAYQQDDFELATETLLIHLPSSLQEELRPWLTNT